MKMIEYLKSNFESVYENSKQAAENCGRNIDDITIIPVSKTKPVELIYSAIDAGMRRFGENYAQELQEKHAAFEALGRKQPEWHYIGGLQRSNVKHIAAFVDMIHSCDSGKLAKEINKRAKEHNRTIDCLLQVNSSGEFSKSGCAPEEILQVAEVALACENLNIRGLMTIGSFSHDEAVIRREFKILRECLDKVNANFNLALSDLSMGMSHDYTIAIDEGATMVRVGTTIFGERNYKQ